MVKALGLLAAFVIVFALAFSLASADRPPAGRKVQRVSASPMGGFVVREGEACGEACPCGCADTGRCDCGK